MPHAASVSSAPRPRGFRVLRWALILAFITGLTGVGATPVVAADDAAAEDTTVSWSARPADTEQGTGRPNFAYELLPGATVDDGILVTNRGADTITLDVYAADGFLTTDGSLDLLARGQASTELGSWIVFSDESVTIRSGESIEVPFEIIVPSTVQPGDYAAGVVASMSVESDSGLVTERRLGSRMHVRVAGDLAPGLTLTDVRLDYHGTLNPFAAGAATATFTLSNTGNARILPAGTIQVAGPFGLGAVAVSLADVPELLPGSSLERSVEIDGVAPLFFTTADLTVGGDVVQRPGAPAHEALVVAEAAASVTAWSVPWVALAIVAAVAGVIVWWMLARRRTKTKHQSAVDAAVAAALAERDAREAEPEAVSEPR